MAKATEALLATPAESAALSQGVLITAISDKGGVGKTPLMRWLTDRFLARELSLPEAARGNLTIVDGDGSTGSLSKFYANRFDEHGARLVNRFSFHGGQYGLDDLVNRYLLPSVDGLGAERVLIDLPAASLSRFREMADQWNFVDAVAHAGYRLVLLCPIFPDDETMLDLQGVIELFDPELFGAFNSAERAEPRVTPPSRTQVSRASYIACVNLNAPSVEDKYDFDEDWYAAEPRGFTRRLLEYVGGYEIVVPKLRARVQRRLAKHRLSFSEGEVAPELDFPDRSRLATWNSRMQQHLRSLSGVLGY